MKRTFAADVKTWSDKALANAEAIFKQSVQDVADQAQRPVAQGGRMPVDTGFLRNSLVSGLNGSYLHEGQAAYVLTITGAELGDTVNIGWTANYAKHVEFGTSKMQARGFMRSALEDWQRIVATNAAKVK